MLTVKEARKLIENDSDFSDQDIREIMDFAKKLTYLSIDYYEKLKDKKKAS